MRVHAVYLALIAVLIIAIVYASAKAVRAGKVLADVEERFGLKEPIRTSLPRKGGEPLRRCTGEDVLRPRTFDQYRREVDALLERAQTLEEFGAKSRLSDACGKALEGGKRLRAIILLEVARATSARRLKAHREGRLAGEEPTPVDAGEVALFVEYLHTASLVVDDLPEFDNDAVRRGRPSLHAAVGPAIAQMAALSLVAAAFQNVCRQIDWIRDHCPEIKNVDRIATRICNDVSRALGALGAAGGQYMDVSTAEDLFREHGPDAVADLVYRKTATFFEIAVLAGWLVAGGEAQQTSVLRDIGRHLGTAFQIADDIGDMARDATRVAAGKPGWNFANEYGRDVARREMERNLKGARLLLTQCSLWTPLWDELYGQFRKMAEDPGEAHSFTFALGEAPAEVVGEAPAEAVGEALAEAVGEAPAEAVPAESSA
jgi:geranylgeranyl diphosphate synthase type II